MWLMDGEPVLTQPSHKPCPTMLMEAPHLARVTQGWEAWLRGAGYNPHTVLQEPIYLLPPYPADLTAHEVCC